ncbi:MAG: DUF3565 domain-containing protein [Sinobacterium sp.]
MAESACGHLEHVRHNPPWIMAIYGQKYMIGHKLPC